MDAPLRPAGAGPCASPSGTPPAGQVTGGSSGADVRVVGGSHRAHRAANARPARPLARGAKLRSDAVAAGNRAAALAANSAEGRNAREREMFLGAGDAPEAPGAQAAQLSEAARRARRRESARRAGRKALATFMAVVLAIGLMPLPAFAADGSLRGVSFNGNVVAASQSTTTTVDADGNVSSETTQTVVDDEGNVESQTTADDGAGKVTINGREVDRLDGTASAYGSYFLARASSLKSDGNIQSLHGHGQSEGNDLSLAAGIEAAKAAQGDDEASQAGDEGSGEGAQSAEEAAQGDEASSPDEGANSGEGEAAEGEGAASGESATAEGAAAGSDETTEGEDKAAASDSDAADEPAKADDADATAKDADDKADKSEAEEAEDPYAAEDAAIDISKVEGDFSAQRIVVALDDGAGLQPRDENNVVTSGGGLYVLAYKNQDAAKRAYVRYTNYEGTAFAAPDAAVEAAAGEDGDDEGDGDGDDSDDPDSDDADATRAETDAPVADLGTLENDQQALESDASKRESEEATKPAEERTVTIALIDTAIASDSAEKYGVEVERVSVINDEQPNAANTNSHGDKMLRTLIDAANETETSAPAGSLRILSIEALDGTGYGSAATIYAALTLATAAKADIVSMSFAGYAVAGNDAVKAGVNEALAAAKDAGRNVALLAAAGNMDQDVRYFVPASYDGVQGVGALDATKLENATADQVTADPKAYKQSGSNFGDGLVWALADTTSYAVARAAGALSALPGALGGGGWAGELQAALLSDAAVDGTAAEEADARSATAEPAEGEGADGADGASADGQGQADDTAAIDEPAAGEDAAADEDGGATEDGAIADVYAGIRTRLAQEGVVAQAGTLTVDLGHSFTKGTTALSYEIFANGATTTASTTNWFQLNNTKLTLEGDTNKITRMVITSSAATATGGVAVHVADTCSGFWYWNLPDTLSSTAVRHKSWTVVFKAGLSTAEAKSFLEKAVYFVTPGGAPTGELVANAANITVQAQCNTSTTDSTLLANMKTDAGSYAKLSTYADGDGPDHFYQATKRQRSFANHYADAKNTYVDGMKGYLATITSTEEETHLKSWIGVEKTPMSANKQTVYNQLLVGMNLYKWGADSVEGDTWSTDGKTAGTRGNSSASNWAYQCGPEAGKAMTSMFSATANWASGGPEWTIAIIPYTTNSTEKLGFSWNDVDGNASWGGLYEYSPYNRTSPTTTGTSAKFDPRVTVTFDNNYTGEIAGAWSSSQTVYFDAGFTAKASGTPDCLRSGYELAAWTSNANGTGNSHAPGATVAGSTYIDNQTLYAKWTAVTVTANLGSSWKLGAASITHDTNTGTASTSKWFQLNNVSFTVSGTSKITRLTITSSAATSTSGAFVHVPATYSGYYYFLQKDALDNATARHKSYTVIFKNGLTAAQAKAFVEGAVYFVTPGAAGTTATDADVANSGATISVRAESAATSDSSWLQTAGAAQLTLSSVVSGDSTDHYYVHRASYVNPANHYNNAKQTIIDGMRGYMVTPVSTAEMDLVLSMKETYTAGNGGQFPLGIERYKWNTAKETYTWSTAGKSGFGNSNSGAYWSYANGPEAGVTPVTVHSTSNWASGDGVWVELSGNAWNDATVPGYALYEFSGYTRVGQAGATGTLKLYDYSITFEAGDHSTSQSSAMAGMTGHSSLSFTVPSASAYSPASGYRFKGWQVSYSGSLTIVQPGDKFTANSDAAYAAGWRDTQGRRVTSSTNSTVKLVAQWERFTNYSIGSGTASPGWQTSHRVLSEADAIVLKDSSDKDKATLATDDKVFAGWATAAAKANAGTVEYAPGAEITTAGLTLYPVYKSATAIAADYTLPASGSRDAATGRVSYSVPYRMWP